MGNSQGKPVVFTDKVNLNHFRLLRVVGKGAFGKVRIVERKDTGLTFALKYIRKDEVVRSESVRNIIRERRMLEHLSHPFLCNLRYSFQDIEYLYIVVDLMNGGDLRFHISRKAFTEDTVRFWIAELGCAIEYIHTQGIVHRDVKPDNVLLDECGHVHLADFNVASDFVPHKQLSSKSGTLAYLAPEIYEGRGYSSEVDWWSLGVTFYECIYNRRPFKGNTHEKLGKEIMESKIEFPVTQPPVSTSCVRAMSAFLDRDRSRRPGAHDFSTFTSQDFFREIDFADLEAKKIDPIFIPSSEKTNFDATYDLEELLLEEAPLEARAKRQRPREQLKGDASEKEIRADELHRMIESLFEPFDYTVVSDPAAPHGSLTSSAGGGPDAIPASSYKSKISGDETGNLTTGNLSPGRTNTTSGSPPLSPTEVPNIPTVPVKANTLNKTSSRLRLHDKANRSGRSTSMTGGVSVVLDEASDWNPTLTDPSNTTPSEAQPAQHKGKQGMLGFLTRKARGSSPKPQERGVLGREGARHIVN